LRDFIVFFQILSFLFRCKNGHHNIALEHGFGAQDIDL